MRGFRDFFRRFWPIGIVGTILIIAWQLLDGSIQHIIFRPTQSEIPLGTTLNQETSEAITTVARDLIIPWEIAFLPDGDMLVTQRAGELLRIGAHNTRIPIHGVVHRGEGGLQGLALHPQFAQNQLLYVYLTTQADGELINRVERYRLEDNELSDRTVIIDNIPGAALHDGGRLAFGPDNYLYITTGDAGNPASAQDIDSLSGKILRLHDDGRIPVDNPFDNAVYSYGHRNPQGLAWDDTGQLWATEHGPSGTQSGFDELNRIVAGGNYGWPVVRGDEQAEGMVSPVIQSGARDTWAPAGAVYIDGRIFFAGLRGESLYAAQLNDQQAPKLRAHFRTEFGRLRAATIGPDGALYISTSNRDGRGDARAGDDRIIRIDPTAL